MKTIFAVVFAFCIIISSCAIKNSIKQFLNFDTPTHAYTSSASKGKFYSLSSSLKCKFCKEKEVLVKDHSIKDFSLSDAQELIAFTFIVLSGAFLLVKASEHPFYNTSKIRGTLPIFLQYRKLII
ncbi:hypothetical protein [Chryseobacterium sp. CFS15]|uniref:hypothetical protein n=1 Tax=Chryseobacterium sp. CFS15 TaxID=2986946 RepID=UPI00280951E9|nr:hypothetical protein [Chryseobacterium sp. CFS15]MDQ8141468.1 hypothetical protein [Chryseobacterium sp. CFS15]